MSTGGPAVLLAALRNTKHAVLAFTCAMELPPNIV
jgi:hypothetical protein